MIAWGLELALDEARGAQVSTVKFSQPVVLYVQNFLGFEVGHQPETSFYDVDQGIWVREAKSRVVKLLQVAGGQAVLDTDGDGKADSTQALGALGVTGEELAQLGQLYQAGQELLRWPMGHFSEGLVDGDGGTCCESTVCSPTDQTWVFTPDPAPPRCPFCGSVVEPFLGADRGDGLGIPRKRIIQQLCSGCR